MICDPKPNQQAPCQGTQIIEHLDSRTSSRDSVGAESWVLHFYILGTNDECEVRRRIEPGTVYGIPATFPDTTFVPIGQLTKNGILPSYPLQTLNINNVGWQIWEVRATYAYDGASLANPAVVRLPTSISMSTRGGNVRIGQSLYTPFAWPEEPATPATGDVTAPLFDNAVEWDGNTVKGISIPSPLTRYSESWIFERRHVFEQVTVSDEQISQKSGAMPAYPEDGTTYDSRMALWEKYTGTVHGPIRYDPGKSSSDPEQQQYDAEPDHYKEKFRGWDPGSVLLDNVNLRQTGLNYFEVTFDFLVRAPYEEALPNDLDSYNASKGEIDGWDHLWYYYAKTSKTVEVKTENNWEVTAPKPSFAYVERVIERRSFKNLGIGTDAFSSNTTDFCASSGYDLMGHWSNVCQAPAEPVQ